MVTQWPQHRHSLCFLLVNDDVCVIRGEGGVPTPRMLAVRMTDSLSRRRGGGGGGGGGGARLAVRCSLFNSTSGGQQHGLALLYNTFEQYNFNVFASRRHDAAFTCDYEESTRSPHRSLSVLLSFLDTHPRTLKHCVSLPCQPRDIRNRDRWFLRYFVFMCIYIHFTSSMYC